MASNQPSDRTSRRLRLKLAKRIAEYYDSSEHHTKRPCTRWNRRPNCINFDTVESESAANLEPYNSDADEESVNSGTGANLSP